jgi:hypothetical protein
MFIVQITATPRIREGLRAVVEDADDVGWLVISGGQLRFVGDAIDLTVSREAVVALRPENIGLRTLFVYGPRLALELRGLDEIKSVEFAERSSLLLPESRKAARRIREAVSRWMNEV